MYGSEQLNIMSIITTGTKFGTTGIITTDGLNNIANLAEFNNSTNESIEVIKGGSNAGKLRIKNSYLVNLMYPVGSIYINATDPLNPATLFGFGTWEEFGAGKTLLGAGSETDDQPIPESLTFAAGDTGGEYNHTVTIPELPSHSHAYNESYRLSSKEDRFSGSSSLGVRPNEQTGLTGGDQSHNNLQPYVAVYTWKRTA